MVETLDFLVGLLLQLCVRIHTQVQYKCSKKSWPLSNCLAYDRMDTTPSDGEKWKHCFLALDNTGKWGLRRVQLAPGLHHYRGPYLIQTASLVPASIICTLLVFK